MDINRDTFQQSSVRRMLQKSFIQYNTNLKTKEQLVKNIILHVLFYLCLMLCHTVVVQHKFQLMCDQFLDSPFYKGLQMHQVAFVLKTLLRMF